MLLHAAEVKWGRYNAAEVRESERKKIREHELSLRLPTVLEFQEFWEEGSTQREKQFDSFYEDIREDLRISHFLEM